MPVMTTAEAKVTSILKSPVATRRSLNVRFAVEGEIIAAIIGYTSHHDLSKYVGILQQLKTGSYSDLDLIDWLQKLTANVCVLDSRCEGLVSGLLKINWPEMSDEVVRGYEYFIVTLVSARINFLKLVLLSLIEKFMPTENNENSGSDIGTISPLEEKVFSTLHKTIKEIIRIVPDAKEELVSFYKTKFPFIRICSHRQLCYIHNLFCTTKYMPTHRRDILAIIVTRLVKMDVLCSKDDLLKWNSEDEDTDEEMETETEMLFELEDVEKSGIFEDGVKAKSKPVERTLANLLDCALDKIFMYIKDECWSQGELDWEATKRLYKELLWIFDQIILPTNAPSHVQFIMFYVCSFRPALVDGFLDFLWKRMENPNTPAILRQSSVCYIGSFLARASFIPIQTVTASFDLIVAWLHRYIDSQDGGSRCYPDVALHGPFFSVCQTVFYVFAFRHKELIEMKGGFDYLNKLNFGRIVSCCLNPLKFCLPLITQNFASVARNLQLAYCYTIIERNNRATLQVASQLPGLDVASTKNALDSFFPFDPYLLPSSRKFIENIYRPYQEAPEVVKTSNEMEDDFLEGIDIISPGISTIPECLFYGTSPGFKPSHFPHTFLNHSYLNNDNVI